MADAPTPPWHVEIDQLHAFFEGYFLGTIAVDDTGRFADVLDDGFTIVGPHGETSSRDETLAMVRQGHAHTSDMTIRCVDHRLVHADGDTTVATYVEEHHWTDGRANRRLATVVFTADVTMPNGLRWVRVHETWVPEAS
ncbi:MAG: DUF4440 domain-containing protein [Actinomycetota bacterium]